MKYMGNKQRIADEILKVIFDNCKDTNTFVDLFCGSCSVIERVPNHYIKIANDKNKFLVEMFKSLIRGNEYSKIINKDDYDARRDLYNLSKRHLVLTDEDYAEIGWYGWMASFNGRFFSGGYSGHNVMQKNGKTRDYITEQINNTLKQIPKLEEVKFFSENYSDVSIPEGSIVYCFDKDTEILTDNGWKYIKDCDIKKDKFFSMDPIIHNLDWVSSIYHTKYHYTGKMYHYKTNEIDLMVTSDHNIFCSKKYSRKRLRKEHFVKANDFFGNSNYDFVNNIGNWNGKQIEYVQINDDFFNAKLICYLIGLFITDGSINNKGAITITQKKIKIINKLKFILDELKLSYSLYKSKKELYTFYFPRKYASFFENFGKNKKDRHIPKFYKELNTELLNYIVEGILDGDSDNERRKIIMGNYPLLIDDIMEILYKTKHSSSVRYVQPRVSFYKKENRYIETKQPYCVISVKNTPYKSHVKSNEKWIDYNDMVYCVTLEKWHTVLVRRNGKCIWCGQCDIPYKGTKQYETSKNFDYENFYNWCRENKNKYQIFISEYYMPEDFKCIWQKEVTNSMNTTKTYKPIEKLFTL